MKTLAQTLFGEASPIVLLTIIAVVFVCISSESEVSRRWGRIVSLKLDASALILMIFVSIAANDAIGAFFWGFALIYTLEQIRKEKGKEKV
ncbi:hypothetical protein HYU91_03850 [Candidatus Collierbacteria bacterium]|nr:hypothetical protein [Candidatus Collierbacteria bacterium]